MAVKKYNPTTPGRRGMSVLTFEEITTSTPEKSLLEPFSRTGGRNNQGKITVRHIGGGAKRKYRVIDFKRNKDNIVGKVATIEYDPNRTVEIALLAYQNGLKDYILAPQGLKIGDLIQSSEAAEINNEKFDAIGGPTLGADPIVGALGVLSYQAQKPVNTFIVRKAPKAHGKQQQIEGPLLKEGSRVILIDDVATTGKAFLESLEVLGGMNILAQKAICIVDRGEGAKQALAQKGCQLVSIFTSADFLK